MTYLSEQLDWPAGGSVEPAALCMADAGAEDIGGAMVYARIRSWIVNTPLPIGRRIRLADVAGTLRVSNTPVREALIRLSTEGLIENRRGSGFFVPIPRVEEAVALFDASHLIVRWSLQQLNSNGWVHVPSKDLRRENGQGNSRPPPDVARLCTAFNQTVVAATKNPVLSGMLGNIDDRLLQLRLIDAGAPDAADRQLAAIENASKAMEAGHGELAVASLTKHHTDQASRIPYLVERRILDGLAYSGEACPSPT